MRKNKKEVVAEEQEENPLQELLLQQPESQEDKCYIYRNDFYFNDDITPETADKFVKSLIQIASEMIANCFNLDLNPRSINIHICSGGGSIDSAIVMMNAIRSVQRGEFTSIGNIKIPLEVNTIIEGDCSSAATLISIVGNHRKIVKGSSVTLHEPRFISIQQQGQVTLATNSRESAYNLEQCSKAMRELYIKFSTNKNLSEKELEEIMNNEKQSSCEEMLKLGLVDEIVE